MTPEDRKEYQRLYIDRPSYGFSMAGGPKIVADLLDEISILEAKISHLGAAFDIPGLTGIWHYHRKDMPEMWCATYIDSAGICDTDEYSTPWEALNAAKNALKPPEPPKAESGEPIDEEK